MAYINLNPIYTVPVTATTSKPKTAKQEERAKWYAKTEWRKLRKIKLQQNPICEICGEKLAEQVHHKVSFMKGTTDEEKLSLLLDYDNLQSICPTCHQHIHNKTLKNK